MAGQSITFDFLSRGAASLSRDFRSIGDDSALSSRGVKILSDVIERLGAKEDRTAAESKILAKALRETGDAADRATAKAVLADAAIRRLGDAEKDAAGKSDGLKKSLDGLKLNPGLIGPALALAPAMATLGGVVAGVGVGLAGAFTAGAGALAAFGAVAKPVLTDAQAAAKKVEAAQSNYNIAIASGTKQSVAYKAEQIAIGKAYAGLSPAQIALSKQLGDMAKAWDAVKAAQTPVVAGALQPWLKSVSDLTKNLVPIIAAVSPVIKGLGGQFDALVGSAAFRAFRDFIAGTGSKVVGAAGGTIIDLVKSFMILLPKFNPLILQMTGGIAAIGPAVLKWATSQKTADQITAFMAWFTKNGPQVGGLLTNLGGALKALAPGLTTGGAVELKVVSDFLGLVAKLPPAIAKPLAEVAGAALILSKMGVLKVGLQVVGPAVKWLTGGLINIGGGAAAGAEAGAAIRTAMVSGGAAAAAQIRAAMTGGGAAAGAAGSEGAAAGAAAQIKNKLPSLLVPVAAALGPILGGLVGGLAARAIGDTLSPKGTLAGRLNANLQGLATTSGGIFSTNLLHSFTFGGLEAWLTAKIGLPVGKVLNDIAAGAKTWGTNLTSGVTGTFSNIAGGARTWWGNITSTVSGAWRTITGTSSAGGTAVARAFGTAGLAADAFRTRNLVPLLGQVGQVSGGIQGLQGFIDRLHGKNITVGVTGTGHGGVVITTSGIAAAGQGNVRFVSGNAARGLYIDRGTTPTADDVLIRASKGELIVPTHMVRAGVVDHLRGMIPGFAAGGLAGIESAIGSMPGIAGGLEGRGGAAAMAAGVKAAIAKAKAGIAAAGGIGNYKPGAGVQQWRGVVSQALAQAGSSQQLVDSVLYQMQTESGGNPTIVNKWDSNWLAGHPSVGLMQVIRGTFQAYAGRYRGTGPFEYGVSVNPLANIYAAIRYAQANYGPGLRNAYGGIGTGHGYAYGTASALPGWAWVGERGPEMVRFRGGEQVIPAGHGGGLDGLAAELRALRGQMAELIHTTAAVPAATGRHVGGAINGAAADAVFRGRYPGR